MHNKTLADRFCDCGNQHASFGPDGCPCLAEALADAESLAEVEANESTDTRTIGFALLIRVSDALSEEPDTVELGLELSRAIADATPKPCLADIGNMPCTNDATFTFEGVPACEECCKELADNKRSTLADCAERGCDDQGCL